MTLILSFMLASIRSVYTYHKNNKYIYSTRWASSFLLEIFEWYLIHLLTYLLLSFQTYPFPLGLSLSAHLVR